MLDNKPSLGVSNDGRDLLLVNILEEHQEELWFFTPVLTTNHNDLEELTLKASNDLVIEPLTLHELMNRYAPEILTTGGIITATHYLLMPLGENCGIGYIGQICGMASFSLEVLVDIIGGLSGGYFNLKLQNMKYHLIQSKDKKMEGVSFIDARVRKKSCSYGGRKYRPIVMKYDILKYVDKMEDKPKLKQTILLNLSAHIQKGINLLEEPFEFPYILKKKTKGNTYYYVGLIEADRDGKIELTALSDEKGIANEKGKSEAYRHKYDEIRTLAKKLKIIRTNRT